jgi:hypothetical protein
MTIEHGRTDGKAESIPSSGWSPPAEAPIAINLRMSESVCVARSVSLLLELKYLDVLRRVRGPEMNFLHSLIQRTGWLRFLRSSSQQLAQQLRVMPRFFRSFRVPLLRVLPPSHPSLFGESCRQLAILLQNP